MKKLLLTIFAVAALVACDKDAIDTDLAPSNIVEPIESVEAINASVELDIDALSARLQRLANAKGMESKESSTSKINGIGAYLTVISGVSNNNFYEFVSSDDINMCDAPALFDVVYLVQNSDYHIEVRLIAPSGSTSQRITTIPLDVRTLFTFSFTEALGVDLSTFNPTIVDGAGIPKFTVGSDLFNLACASDYYEVTDAPFPLRGHLATISAANAASILNIWGGSSLNYAGTSMDAVVTEIETQIKNGQ